MAFHDRRAIVERNRELLRGGPRHESEAAASREIGRARLEETVCDHDFGPDELALAHDLLQHERACVEDELQVERLDVGACVAPARPDLLRGPDLLTEARIAAGEACEDAAPLGHCVAIRGGPEYRVALELGQREWRHEPAHDPVQETREDRVRPEPLRPRFVVAMRKGDRLEECGVAADVGENEWPARRSRGAGARLAWRARSNTTTRAPSPRKSPSTTGTI